MVTAVILAAGESRRMGSQNKLLLPFKGKTIVEHVVDHVLESAAAEVIVVLGHEADRIREQLKIKPVRFAMNHEFQLGMTTSIRAGVAAASPNAEGFMICLSDLPFITAQEFTQLIRAFEAAHANSEKQIVVPVHQGRRGNPVIFSARFKDEILAHKGLQGCKGLIKERPDKVLEVEVLSKNALQDIDTPEDYCAIAQAAAELALAQSSTS